jgi:hypothetical protein
VLIEAMRGSFKPHVQAKPHRVLSPGSCGHQAAERAADGGASSMPDDLMFKFWELSAINVVELIFVPGSHSFGSREATPEGENTWNNRWN